MPPIPDLRVADLLPLDRELKEGEGGAGSESGAMVADLLPLDRELKEKPRDLR